MADHYFNQDTFQFLKQLDANNEREWFQQNRDRYEETVRTPALNFISDMAADLAIISPHFLALPKKVGGSLMRVYRDTRFGKDKRPYKINIGIQFRHEVGKDVHAPGYYLHVEPGNCFVGVGVWRPDSTALGKIRTAISERPDAWLTSSADKAFSNAFSLEGESLIKPPRGYAKDHPLLEDLKRKDHIAISNVSDKAVTAKNFRGDVVKLYGQATPYMQFLCKALELRF